MGTGLSDGGSIGTYEKKLEVLIPLTPNFRESYGMHRIQDIELSQPGLGFRVQKFSHIPLN